MTTLRPLTITYIVANPELIQEELLRLLQENEELRQSLVVLMRDFPQPETRREQND